VLAGAGLGDEAGLAHAPRQQPLPEHLVGLVRAAVEQVLALQLDVAGEVAAAGERGRAARVVGEQAAQLRTERGIILSIEERRLELLERGDKDLGDEASAEPSEAAV